LLSPLRSLKNIQLHRLFFLDSRPGLQAEPHLSPLSNSALYFPVAFNRIGVLSPFFRDNVFSFPEEITFLPLPFSPPISNYCRSIAPSPLAYIPPPLPSTPTLSLPSPPPATISLLPRSGHRLRGFWGPAHIVPSASPPKLPDQTFFFFSASPLRKDVPLFLLGRPPTTPFLQCAQLFFFPLFLRQRTYSPSFSLQLSFFLPDCGAPVSFPLTVCPYPADTIFLRFPIDLVRIAFFSPFPPSYNTSLFFSLPWA